MKALFKSHNLLGDGLNIYPALAQWHKEHPDAEIFMECIPDYTQEIYTRMGLPVTVVDKEAYNTMFDFYFDFNVNEAFRLADEQHLHITHAYAKMLDVPAKETIEGYRPMFIPTEEEHEKDLILFSIFSKSCSSQQGKTANKMLPWWKVDILLDYFKQFGKIGILGGPEDRAPIKVAEEQYYTGLPLNKVALMLRDCKLLVTIDNGIAHLAASQKAKTLLLYPKCLNPTWIVPYGNPNMNVIQIDPATVNMPDLMWTIMNRVLTEV